MSRVDRETDGRVLLLRSKGAGVLVRTRARLHLLLLID